MTGAAVKDALVRALKTFVQTFVAIIGIDKIPGLTPITVSQVAALPWVGAAIAGAVAAVLSLAMNLTGKPEPTPPPPPPATPEPVAEPVAPSESGPIDPVTGAPTTVTDL